MMKKMMKILAVFPVMLSLSGASRAQVPLRTEFFFPHVVDGRVSGEEDDDDVFRTIVVLKNPNEAATTATVSLFLFQTDGTSVEDSSLSFRCLVSGGPCTQPGDLLTAADLVDFTIAGRGMVQLMTARTEASVVQGYARVNSTEPISGMAIFTQAEEEFDEDENEVEVEIEGQAAVEPTGRMTGFAVTDFRKNEFELEINGLEFEFESESSTGLAVVNLGEVETTLTLTLFDSEGNQVGESVTRTLAAGAHDAFFLSELLAVPEDFVVGTVIVESSDTEVTAVALKFDEEDDDEGDKRLEFTVAPVTQLAP